MQATRRILFAAALWTSLACITINVHFPEKAIQDLSRDIEREVQRRAAEAPAASPAPAPTEEKSGSPSAQLFDALLGATPATAAGVAAPEVSSPAIQKIIASRAARVADLNRLKGLGAIGENREALVEPRDLAAIKDLSVRAEVARLVKAENADREELFREIAVAKGVDTSQLPKIRETYAVTLRENAQPGEWVQSPDGSWARK